MITTAQPTKWSWGTLKPDLEITISGLSVVRAFQPFGDRNGPLWQDDIHLAHWGAISWLSKNEGALGNYRGLWVAVTIKGVIASARSLDELHKHLLDKQIQGALVHYVPEDALDKWKYLVA